MPLNKGLLQGKCVVVLGASRGVGREIVRRVEAKVVSENYANIKNKCRVSPGANDRGKYGT